MKYLTRIKRINTRDHDIIVTINRHSDSFGKTLHEITLITDADVTDAEVARQLADASARLLDTEK